MILDNLTVSALVIAIMVVIMAIVLTRHTANTDKKIHRMARQLSLIQHNEKAFAYCKHIYSKYPELCVGIDFTLKSNGDDVEIDEWHSSHPRPDRQ